MFILVELWWFYGYLRSCMLGFMWKRKKLLSLLWKAFSANRLCSCINEEFPSNFPYKSIYRGRGNDTFFDKINYMCRVSNFLLFPCYSFGKRKHMMHSLPGNELVMLIGKNWVHWTANLLFCVLFPFMFQHRENLGIYVLKKTSG